MKLTRFNIRAYDDGYRERQDHPRGDYVDAYEAMDVVEKLEAENAKLRYKLTLAIGALGTSHECQLEALEELGE